MSTSHIDCDNTFSSIYP